MHDPLTFPAEKGQVKTLTLEGRTITFRAFEQIDYCTNPKDPIQKLNIFVPEGRSDIVYCTYPSPQNKEKSCREVGAQVARANKEKNDVVTGAYRKAYMRYKMMTKRHPHDKAKAQQFENLTEGMKEWRTKLAEGPGTNEDFLDWLSQF